MFEVFVNVRDFLEFEALESFGQIFQKRKVSSPPDADTTDSPSGLRAIHNTLAVWPDKPQLVNVMYKLFVKYHLIQQRGSY